MKTYCLLIFILISSAEKTIKAKILIGRVDVNFAFAVTEFSKQLPQLREKKTQKLLKQ